MTRQHYQMVNVADKPMTQRMAIATGCIQVGPQVFDAIVHNRLPKGDALVLAEIAGIQAAKNTAQWIPLCHPLNLDQVRIYTALDEMNHRIHLFCQVNAYAKTGVEMEALTGVHAALLSIYDLSKMLEPALKIDGIRLIIKLGGKKGQWIHPDGIPPEIQHLLPQKKPSDFQGLRVSILKTSDRASTERYEDIETFKQNFENKLNALGMQTIAYHIIANDADKIKQYLRTHIEKDSPDLIITLGGTGLSPRDTTPDIIGPLCSRLIPGLGELLRLEGAKYNPYAWLSRCIVGIIDDALIMTLPGNPKAAHEGIDILEHILIHAFQSLQGHPK